MEDATDAYPLVMHTFAGLDDTLISRLHNVRAEDRQ